VKREEECAAKFLKTRFNAEPIYEPLGTNTAPDFAVGQIAFEVRRLNQRYVRQDGTDEPLEETDYRLNWAVYGEFRKIPFSERRGTFFWGLDFRRPLQEEPGKIARRLAELARNYYEGDSLEDLEVEMDNLSFLIFPSEHPFGVAFIPGFRGDKDSGGIFGDIYPTSIGFALAEKIRKTKAVASKFRGWGLLLVDDIGHGMLKANDLGRVDFQLGHFNTLGVINWDSSLAFEWPEGSMKKL